MVIHPRVTQCPLQLQSRNTLAQVVGTQVAEMVVLAGWEAKEGWVE